MPALLQGVAAVDLAIGLLLLEGLLLALHHRRTGRGIALVDAAAALAAGLFLMLALRAALAGDGWPTIAAALAAAGVAHALDLKRRWRRAHG